MLRHHTLAVTAFAQNCSIVWCDQTLQAAVIDPGGEVPRIVAELQRLGLQAQAIWLTHAHIDHAGGVAELRQQLGLTVVGPHPGDQFWIDGLAEQARMFGFPAVEGFTPDRWLHDGELLRLGNSTLVVRHCPGHTPGHVVFHCAEAQLVFVGDVLFQGSVGRTDFPGGNHQQLQDSIRTRLWPMGDATRFVPGHGPMGELGHERLHNPFVRSP